MWYDGIFINFINYKFYNAMQMTGLIDFFNFKVINVEKDAREYQANINSKEKQKLQEGKYNCNKL